MHTYIHIYMHVYIYVYIHTVEHYSAVTKKEIMNILGKWVELGKIILNEVTLTHRDKCHKCSFLAGFLLGYQPPPKSRYRDLI